MAKLTSARFPENLWYGHGVGSRLWAFSLLPATLLYAVFIVLRRLLYRIGLLAHNDFPLPVVVVGNITAGGTGKTPLVIALVERLREQGWKPGVVSRGYGGNARSYPLHLRSSTPVAESGDEPALIARRTACPVVVSPDRSSAVRALLAEHAVDIIISDDGLQHYRMGRNAEIAVIDGRRRFGNGQLLPSGPLREPVGRLQQVDMVIVNDGNEDEDCMHLEQTGAISIVTGRTRPLLDFVQGRLHAVAGIGHPQRFFDQLEAQGLDIVAHPFPDHHVYQPADLEFGDNLPILMSEKDAVKCRTFANDNCWYVPVVACFNELAEAGLNRLATRLGKLRKTDGQKAA